MQIIKQSFQFFIGSLLAILLIELGVRLIENTPAWHVLPLLRAELHLPDKNTGFNRRAHFQGFWLNEQRTFIQTFEHGFRGRSITQKKSPNMFRVVMLGDSYLEAVQVDWKDTFAARLESSLEEVQVLNFGVGAFHPLMMLEQLRHHAMSFSPDMIFFFLSVEDFHHTMKNDSVYPAYVKGKNGQMHIGRSYRQRRSQQLIGTPLFQLFFWLQEHSRVAAIAYQRIKFFWLDWPKSHTLPSQQRSDICEGLFSHKAYQFWVENSDPDQFDRVEQLFHDLNHVVGGADIPIIFAVRGIGKVFPECAQHQEHRQQLQIALKSYLESKNVILFDTDQHLVNKTKSNLVNYRSLFGFDIFKGRGHLNEDGHKAYHDIVLPIIHQYQH